MKTSRENNTSPVSGTTDRDRKQSISMHEDIPVWYDCCSCEAEPYWLDAMAESGDSPPEATNVINKVLKKNGL